MLIWTVVPGGRRWRDKRPQFAQSRDVVLIPNAFVLQVHCEAVRGLLASLILLALWAVPSNPAPQRPGQPQIRIPDLERRIHALINKERTSQKLKPLELEERLSKIARSHSQDMARRDFFSHVNPDGKDPTARGEARGYTCRKISGNTITEGLAENIFQGNLYSRIRIRGSEKTYDWNSMETIATEGVTGWMKSPGHRENILTKTYQKTGMGVTISKDDKVYVTQLFC
jgi:uncharacterized protein YkwD